MNKRDGACGPEAAAGRAAVRPRKRAPVAGARPPVRKREGRPGRTREALAYAAGQAGGASDRTAGIRRYARRSRYPAAASAFFAAVNR